MRTSFGVVLLSGGAKCVPALTGTRAPAHSQTRQHALSVRRLLLTMSVMFRKCVCAAADVVCYVSEVRTRRCCYVAGLMRRAYVALACRYVTARAAVAFRTALHRQRSFIDSLVQTVTRSF